MPNVCLKGPTLRTVLFDVGLKTCQCLTRSDVVKRCWVKVQQGFTAYVEIMFVSCRDLSSLVCCGTLATLEWGLTAGPGVTMSGIVVGAAVACATATGTGVGAVVDAVVGCAGAAARTVGVGRGVSASRVLAAEI